MRSDTSYKKPPSPLTDACVEYEDSCSQLTLTNLPDLTSATSSLAGLLTLDLRKET